MLDNQGLLTQAERLRGYPEWDHQCEQLRQLLLTEAETGDDETSIAECKDEEWAGSNTLAPPPYGTQPERPSKRPK